MGTVEKGSPAFRKINLAFFAAGFVTFLTLYDVQPLLPVFTREFGVPAAMGSLPLSVATCALAITMLVAGSLSDSWGRKPVMVVSLFLTSILAILTALTHSFPSLVALRTLQGVVLGGIPAVAMAYLGEEVAPSSLGTAMGLYIGGNAMGGMSGRIFTAAMTDYFPWRTAILSIGVACLVLSLYFTRSLPPSAHQPRRPFEARHLWGVFRQHLSDRGLLTLYLMIFLMMGAFVTLYNYVTFRLLAPPYRLTQTHISWIFLAYLLGSCSSAAAGNLVKRMGREGTIRIGIATMGVGVGLTLLGPLPLIILGIVIFTCGFFGGHAVASTWVGTRARTGKAQASALYLCFYYVGSSVSGTVGGLFWTAHRWEGVAGLIGGLLAVGLVLSLRLGRVDGGSEAAVATRSEEVPGATFQDS